MIVVDTSVWIEVWRDETGGGREALARELDDEDPGFTRFTQAEMLRGALDEEEWRVLDRFFESQDYLEMTPQSWVRASRIHFDLRRRGKTVRSLIDCCIAQLVLEREALLLHRDGDFEVIAEVRPLRQRRFEL